MWPIYGQHGNNKNIIEEAGGMEEQPEVHKHNSGMRGGMNKRGSWGSMDPHLRLPRYRVNLRYLDYVHVYNTKLLE